MLHKLESSQSHWQEESMNELTGLSFCAKLLFSLSKLTSMISAPTNNLSNDFEDNLSKRCRGIDLYYLYYYLFSC